ncbi:MAG: CDP-alcohol phosphatidyltransferase family protein [Phycisphaerae bacterium]
MSWPNRITIARLLMVPVFVMLLLQAREHWACRYGAMGLAVLIGLADAAGGIRARRMGEVTRLGSILDPLADYAFGISAMVTLSIPGVLAEGDALTLPYWVSVTLVSRALFMLGGAVVLYLVCGLFQGLPSISGKGATIMQFITVGITCLAPDLLAWVGPAAWHALYGVWGVTVALAVVSLIGYIRTGSKLLAAREQSA